MTQRGRRNSQYNETPSGGNVLFTLGLVSVVALLVVGYIMTQGGVQSLAENGLNIKNKISLIPTPTPTLTPVAIVQPSPTPAPAVDAVVQKYESDLKTQKETYEAQLKQLRTDYETQIQDLNTRIQILEMSNKTLRAKGK